MNLSHEYFLFYLALPVAIGHLFYFFEMTFLRVKTKRKFNRDINIQVSVKGLKGTKGQFTQGKRNTLTGFVFAKNLLSGQLRNKTVDKNMNCSCHFFCHSYWNKIENISYQEILTFSF